MLHDGPSFKRRDTPDIAVVGATGAVGREVLGILADRGVHPERVRALASARSVGVTIPYGTTDIRVRTLDERAFNGCALAIFTAGNAISRTGAPIATAAGAVVIDNSSAFRLDPDVPLIVPEVNGAELSAVLPHHRTVIANPNCTTIILVTALEPLRRAFGIEAVDVATYQAVSGAGLAAIDELLSDTREALAPTNQPHEYRQRVFAEPCAFNVFSHDSHVDPRTGVNGEERKVIDEVRKIWSDPTLRVTPTCVRVPVLRAHTEAITVTLEESATEEDVRDALVSGEGFTLLDDRAGNRFPTPRNATGRDEILIGRVRPDPGEVPDAQGRHRRWCLLVCGDQLRKGAALNAVQIADILGLLPTPTGSVVTTPRAVLAPATDPAVSV